MRKKIKNEPPLKMTLKHLQKALADWNEIPDGTENELEQLRRKTRELIQKLNEQIRALDL